ncbi:hypothetical protein MCEMSEM23_00292 [Rhabdaerophilaceae bacterium]
MTIRFRLIVAGAAYFGLVFAAGFALGSIRVILLQPYLGAKISRLLELPVMIVLSYCAAVLVTRQLGPAGRSEWFKVGFLAFVLLLGAELIFGYLLFRTGLTAFIKDVVTLLGFLNLLSQGLIIIFPALAAGWDRTRS